MARSRNIKPGFFTNEDLVELDFATRLLFAGLWTVADREGRLQDRPKKIKIDVFPADNLDIDAMLTALHNGKFITRYEVDGSKFIQISNWSKHQNPHHTEKASEIPGIDGVLTVKAPLEPKESPKQDGGNLADSLLLIPDSLIPDSLGGKVPPPILPECLEYLNSTRPELNAGIVWAKFLNHLTPDKRTAGAWRKFVLSEYAKKPAAAIPDTADPDSKASIIALAQAQGLPKWNEATEQWSVFKARVQGVPA
jgi:hypothetical protein